MSKHTARRQYIQQQWNQSSNGYAQSLARRIFERLIDIQTDVTIKRERPRLSSSGFLFNQQDIEQVIEQHDKEMN